MRSCKGCSLPLPETAYKDTHHHDATCHSNAPHKREWTAANAQAVREETDAVIGTLVGKPRRLRTAGMRAPEAVQVNTHILQLDPDNLPALTRRGL